MQLRWLSLAIGLFLSLVSQVSFAESEHQLLRKIAVFPLSDANFSSSEDAWWQMREFLTRDKKLLIASKRFMINRGVFQPRKNLKPADAIILGRLLDAQALMTTYLEDRTLKMKVYDGENGYVLWESEAQFHPAISVNDQLIKVSTKLTSDFLQAIPYQGFTLKDELLGKDVFEKDGKTYARVFVGGALQPQVGDAVQWVSIVGDPNQAYFLNCKSKVFAEGQVAKIEESSVIIEISKTNDPNLIKENSLVRFPKELSQLKDLYRGDDRAADLSSEVLSSEMKPISEFQKGHYPTSSAIAWLLNIAAFVLIAF